MLRTLGKLEWTRGLTETVQHFLVLFFNAFTQPSLTRWHEPKLAKYWFTYGKGWLIRALQKSWITVSRWIVFCEQNIYSANGYLFSWRQTNVKHWTRTNKHSAGRTIFQNWHTELRRQETWKRKKQGDMSDKAPTERTDIDNRHKNKPSTILKSTQCEVEEWSKKKKKMLCLFWRI